MSSSYILHFEIKVTISNNHNFSKSQKTLHDANSNLQTFKFDLSCRTRYRSADLFLKCVESLWSVSFVHGLTSSAHEQIRISCRSRLEAIRVLAHSNFGYAENHQQSCVSILHGYTIFYLCLR